MPGPGPKYITSANADNLAAVQLAVADYVAKAGAPFTSGRGATGFVLESANAICRLAGLACDWPTLRARAISLNKRIPGWVHGPGPAYDESLEGDGKLLRAWVAANAPDLIDATAEQPSHSYTWGWW